MTYWRGIYIPPQSPSNNRIWSDNINCPVRTGLADISIGWNIRSIALIHWSIEPFIRLRLNEPSLYSKAHLIWNWARLLGRTNLMANGKKTNRGYKKKTQRTEKGIRKIYTNTWRQDLGFNDLSISPVFLSASFHKTPTFLSVNLFVISFAIIYWSIKRLWKIHHRV